MKTTLDLPDELLIKAKEVAVRRRTTLKEMVTRSLRREIGMDKMPPSLSSESPFEIGAMGLPVLKKRGVPITSEDVRNALNEADEEDCERAVRGAQRK
jgi:hypothetical protein